MESRPAISPRESMTALPAFLQPFLTWLTGKPAVGQSPVIHWTPFTRTLAGLSSATSGIVMLAVAANLGGWLLLLAVPGLLHAVGGLRALYLEIAHNAVHNLFRKRHWLNRAITELFTLLTWMPGYDVFRREHVISHHGYTGTDRDPDYAALVSWGFAPGVSLSQLRRRTRESWWNPAVHFSYLSARTRGILMDGPVWRRILGGAWLATLVIATFTIGSPLAWFAALWAPLTWGFQMSSVLQMLSGEHRWGRGFASKDERRRGLTRGRFLGDPYPSHGAFAKLRWWLRLVFLHYPARVAVYVGNDIGPAHDVHHRIPDFDWSNAAYAREELIASGRLDGAEDVWGSLFELIDGTLVDLSRGAESEPAELERAKRAA
jgi:hypothetical protein